MEEFCCKNCGGELLPNQIEGTLKCKNCGSVFTHDEAEKERAFLQEALDEIKREKLLNLRKRLWEQINRKYTDSSAIVSVCREIKSVHAEDFLANFFEVANSGTAQEVNAFLDEIDVNENYGSIETVVNFMVKSLQSEYLLSLNNLVERAYKSRGALEKFEEVTTRVEAEANKLNEGVYELTLTRDVFVAYSSKDMKKVQELVTALESQGLSCFVALRNLQHGRGSVENYQRALETAMDNCKMLVFISSQNSRNFGCDAIKHELPYLKKTEMAHLPPELHNTPYEKVPSKYKKPRIEWRLDDTKGFVDKFVGEIFAGLERCYTVESVAERVCEYMFSGWCGEEETPENAQIQAIMKELEALKRVQNNSVQTKAEKIEVEGSCKRCGGNLYEDEYGMIRCVTCSEQYIKDERDELIRVSCDFCGGEVERIREGVYKCRHCGHVQSLQSMKNRKTDQRDFSLEEIIEKGKQEKEEKFASIRNLAICIRSLEKKKIVERIRKENEAGIEENRRIVEANHNVEDRLADERRGTEELLMEKIRNVEEKRKKEEFALVEKQRMEEFYLGQGFEIKNGVLVNYGGDENCVVIPDIVTSIEEGAFYNCESLVEIIIPSSVTTIGDRAFNECRNLSNVTIGNGVTSIGDEAFLFCNALSKIIIPNNVTSIGEDVFSWCDGLTSIAVDNNNTIYTSIDGNLYSKDGKTIIQYAAGKNLKSFTIPNGVTTIGKSSFNACKSLKEIIIPNSVTVIEEDAFSFCEGLTKIVIPNSVTYIGSSAFYKCSSLSKIMLPNSITTINDSMFENCVSLTDIVIPNSVTSIHDNVFTNCSNLNKIIIPSSVNYVGFYAFSNCKNLESAIVGEKINLKVFSSCPKVIIKRENKIFVSILAEVRKGMFNDKHLEFFCEADKEPATWEKGWKPGLFTKVHWGVKIEDFLK